MFSWLFDEGGTRFTFRQA